MYLKSNFRFYFDFIVNQRAAAIVDTNKLKFILIICPLLKDVLRALPLQDAEFRLTNDI